VAAPLLDGGQRAQADAQARAAADQAVASYRQTVLQALQEVEDNLVLMQRLAEEVEAQRHATEAARRNLAIVQAQYAAGTVSFLNVSTAQTALLTAQSALLSVQTRQLLAASVLLKNVGGRWTTSA
jgi:outer membrane protein TolC